MQIPNRINFQKITLGKLFQYEEIKIHYTHIATFLKRPLSAEIQTISFHYRIGINHDLIGQFSVLKNR